MSRYVSAEGGSLGEDFSQLPRDDEGNPLFPDELGEPSIAQALLVGLVRDRKIGPKDQSFQATQPRRREVVAILNEITGEMRFDPYSLQKHDILPVEAEIIIARSSLGDQSKLNTVLRRKTTRAYRGTDLTCTKF